MLWTRKRLVKVAGVAVTALAVAQAGWGQAPPRRQARPRFWQNPTLREELGLTQAQVEQLKARFYETARSKLKLQTEVRLAELELEQLMDAAEPDAGAVEAKARQIGELRARLYQQKIGERLSLKRILRPEQVEKLRQMGLRARGRARPQRPRRRGSPSGRRVRPPRGELPPAGAFSEGQEPSRSSKLPAHEGR